VKEKKHNSFLPDADVGGLRGKYFSTTLVMLNTDGDFVTSDCDGVDVRGLLLG
jgi:hypothetical protein